MKTAPGKNPAWSTGQQGVEEEGSATYLEYSENHSARDEALEVLHYSHARHDDSPAYNQERQPDARSDLLQDNIGRHL